MEYQARLKRAAKAPQRAEQQIRFLDKMIQHVSHNLLSDISLLTLCTLCTTQLKQTRSKAGSSLDKTNHQLADVQNELDVTMLHVPLLPVCLNIYLALQRINERYIPSMKLMEQRIQERERLKEQMAKVEQALQGVGRLSLPACHLSCDLPFLCVVIRC